MVATAIKRPMPLNTSCYPVVRDDGLLPIRDPTVVLSFKRTPASRVMDLLSDQGFDRQEVRGKSLYIFQNHTNELLRTLIEKGAIQTSIAPLNTLNIQAYREYILIRRIFSAFFLTHTSYPAYTDPDHLLAVEEDSEDEIVIDESASVGDKRKAESLQNAQKKKMRLEEVKFNRLGPPLRFLTPMAYFVRTFPAWLSLISRWCHTSYNATSLDASVPT